MSKVEPVYCFVHIGNTGGTTFNAHLYRQLAWDEEFIHIGSWRNQYRREHNRVPIGQRSQEELQRVKVFSGHGVRYGTHRMVGRPGRYFTILRDPADRLLSTYNFKERLGTQKRSF